MMDAVKHRRSTGRAANGQYQTRLVYSLTGAILSMVAAEALPQTSGAGRDACGNSCCVAHETASDKLISASAVRT